MIKKSKHFRFAEDVYRIISKQANGTKYVEDAVRQYEAVKIIQENELHNENNECSIKNIDTFTKNIKKK